MTRIPIFLFLILSLFFSVTQAQESSLSNSAENTSEGTAGSGHGNKAETALKDPEMNELNLRLRKTAEALFTNLSTQEMKDAYQLRNQHGIIKSVESVRQDLVNSTQSCIENHSDKRAEITDSFNRWKNEINPRLEKASINLDKRITENKAMPESLFRKYLALIERMAETADSKVQKDYITSKEACDFLVKKLETSRDELSGVLNDILPQESN